MVDTIDAIETIEAESDFQETDFLSFSAPRRSKPAKSRIPITTRELVEWTYAEQRAQGVPELNIGSSGGSQTGIVVDRLIDFARLGCEVDVFSKAAAIWGQTRCHEDALMVHSIIDGMSDRSISGKPSFDPVGHRRKRLLMEHALDRSMPDWQPKIFPLRCVPIKRRGGKPRGLYLGSGRKLVGHEITYEGDWPSREMAGDFSAAADAHKRAWSDPENWPGTYRRRSSRPMVVEHDWSAEPYRRCADEVLQRARHEYREWYEGLLSLTRSLYWAGERGLQRYSISGVGAAAEPWNMGGKA